MIGAIAGDIIGSVYERRNIKTTGFELFSPGSTFTDDTEPITTLKGSKVPGRWRPLFFWPGRAVVKTK